MVRLLDGTKAYVHAVIDNFSRRILAFRVADCFDIANALSVLVNAAHQASASVRQMLHVVGPVDPAAVRVQPSVGSRRPGALHVRVLQSAAQPLRVRARRVRLLRLFGPRPGR